MNTLPRFRPVIWLLLACLGPVLRAAAPAPAQEIVALPKFEVNGTAICCYGFGITATWNEKTQRIEHAYIDDVSPGSQAEEIGLKRGDEILSLNGRKIAGMKGGGKRDGELFELLVNQPVGRIIEVEVAVRVVKRVVLTAIP